MKGDESDRDKLARLAARISKAQKAADSSHKGPVGSYLGRVGGRTKLMRLGTDFVATVLAGLGLGWFVDEQFGIAPWGLIGLLLGSVVLAFWNLIWSTFDKSDAPKGAEPEE